MKAVLVLWLTLISATCGELAPPERSYKILMLLPVSTNSHRNVFLPLAEALADRGHKIVMLVNNPPVTKHPNIEEIEHGLPDFRTEHMNLFNARSNPAGAIEMFKTVLPSMAKKLYKISKVKSLYERRRDFDLIAVNQLFNELTYPFVHEMPFITIATTAVDPRQSAVLGNVLNPTYAPNLMDDYPRPMNILNRFRNTIGHIIFAFYWRQWAVIPPVQKEISDQFPDLPPLLDIERNQSLTLMNSHFSLGVTLPLLPSQVQVGAMHCRPGKPLPKDIESFIKGAGSEGVVYFSLGSVAQGDSMPSVFKEMFLEAFKKLKQRVIWKYETELDGIPSNVMIWKWLPQQDILAHPNVKVFISHGGLLSTHEALYHGTPILVLPIYGDQAKNSITIQENGIGLELIWENLSVDSIVKSLQELISNPKYQMNAKSVQKTLRDQLQSPTERAVYWSEYVIRHKGAPHLRSPAAQLTWVEFLMLDVLLLLHLFVFIVFWLLRRLTRAVCRQVFGANNKQAMKRTKKE